MKLGLTRVRDEQTFKYRDGLYRRVRIHDGEPIWFQLVDGDWVQMLYTAMWEMERAFCQWESGEIEPVTVNV